MAAALRSAAGSFVNSGRETAKEYIELANEIGDECTPQIFPTHHYLAMIAKTAGQWIHVPYFPPFHRPGWLVRYFVGPYDVVWVENLIADVCAGVTVALTLIPQALSYAALANLAPVQGLYAAILPSAVYTFLGSSMQLAVGPVAIVSLLTGTLVAKWQPDYLTNFKGAADTAAQASLCAGIIMTCMGLLNLGSFIHFISHPVMSGFTTGAAMSIGLSQVKNAFGFQAQSTIPQQGMHGYENNYQLMAWYAKNWNNSIKASESAINAGRFYTNHYAISICFGLYVPLIFISLLKQSIKQTPERKKKLSFKIWTICSSLTPFAAIIIGAHIAYRIKSQPDQSYYAKNLKIVGKVEAGLDIMKIPTLRHPFGAFFADCIPIALVLFMESYSVARRIASTNNELHILNASQELIANGVANLLGSVSSAYPMSGSFSRSSLNQSCGAKTPMSKATTLFVVLIALSTLTETFHYIPQAALAAVIMVSINALISFSDMWEAFRQDKMDFIVLMTTLIITFVTDTSIGLAVGIGCSILFYLADVAFSARAAPVLVSYSKENNGIDVVKLQGDFTFIQAAKVKDYVNQLHLSAPPSAISASNKNEAIFRTVTGAFDKVLNPSLLVGVLDIPHGIVIDLEFVRNIDLTGLITLAEMFYDGRRKGIKMLAINGTAEVQKKIVKFGISNDFSTAEVDISKYVSMGGIIPVKVLNEDEIEKLTMVGLPGDERKDIDEAEKGMSDSNISIGDNNSTDRQVVTKSGGI